MGNFVVFKPAGQNMKMVVYKDTLAWNTATEGFEQPTALNETDFIIPMGDGFEGAGYGILGANIPYIAEFPSLITEPYTYNILVIDGDGNSFTVLFSWDGTQEVSKNLNFKQFLDAPEYYGEDSFGAVLARLYYLPSQYSGLEGGLPLADGNGWVTANVGGYAAAQSPAEQVSPPTAVEIRQEMDNNSTKLTAIDAKTTNLPADPASNTQVNTRLATAGYTAPANASIGTILTTVQGIAADYQQRGEEVTLPDPAPDGYGGGDTVNNFGIIKKDC